MENFNNIENDVLNLVLEGYENREIACKLNYSISKIKTVLKEIYKKLGVSNRVQAVVAAMRILKNM